MSDHLETEEIDMLVELIKFTSRQAMLVPLDKAQELLAQQGREDTLLPLLDPTLYMQARDKTEWHKPYLQAFVRYRAELQRIAEQEGVGK